MGMSANRVIWYRQGVALTTANTTYPTSTPEKDSRGIQHTPNSNTDGVWIPKRGVDQEMLFRLTASASGAADVSFQAVCYGYIRNVISTDTTTGAKTVTAVNKWDELFAFNSGTAITKSTGAVGGVTVIALSSTTIMWDEKRYVGSEYERVLVIPITLTGTGTLNFIADVGMSAARY